ncbi:hypothetical protein KOY48_01490 [Candidatus Minimicrobia naudis]|uniref:Uncharacterized protein n=1 Tax=Candidatus Minimicrobia naudis TaxID=2841263 RepID=A0A8F1MCE7_9BACT|nr:hypothetical protein KOY48_01490 [Candidatus Minimicrobia naudis]
MTILAATNNEVEVIINVPDKKITAKDSTMNVLAAVDIVGNKVERSSEKSIKTTCWRTLAEVAEF